MTVNQILEKLEAIPSDKRGYEIKLLTYDSYGENNGESPVECIHVDDLDKSLTLESS